MTIGQPVLFHGFVVFLAVPGLAGALQRPAPPDAAPYIVRQWDTRSGLAQNTVNDIAQTTDGYLWLATFGGLARFDGLRFTLFTSKTYPDIGSDRGLSLAVDSAGALWVGTENGLVRHAAGSFTTFTTRDGLPHTIIYRVYVDGRGTLWVVTERGLARFDPGARAFTAVDAPSVSRELEEDDAGVLWARTDAGLARLDPASGRFVGDSSILRPRDVTRIVGRDRDGALWLAAPGALVRWRAGQRTVYRRAEFGAVQRLAAAPDGTLWLGSLESGVWHFDPSQGPARARRYAIPQGPTRYTVRTVIVDHEGVPWAGTNVDGLLGFRRRLFTMLPLAQGGAVSTTAILGDGTGRTWVGANCDTVNVVEGGRARMFHLREGPAPNCVWSLAAGAGDTIWFGTWGDYLGRLAGGRLTWLGAAAGLSHDVVLAVHPARDGSVWVGTLGGGLNRLRGDVAEVFDTARGLPDHHVNAIVEDRTGTLWVGTVGGLAALRDGRLTTWTTANGLSHDHVRAILPDSDGTLWIGTYGGGLTRYRNGQLRPITSAHGLFDDAVSAIVDDGRGWLWISSNRGIFHVRRRELEAVADGLASSVHSVAYGPADGLEVVEANGGFQPAAWRAPDGRIWFPTIRGVAILDPSVVTASAAAPMVHIEQLIVDGRLVEPGEAIRVPAGSGNLEVVYTGLSAPAPEGVTFRYRLRGVDRDWVYVGERRVAYYTHLSPGGYTFTVSAANRDGVWSEAGASLGFVIRPPMQQTVWFRIVVIAALASVVVGAVRLRLAERSREAERAFARRLLESQEVERKRIASELHDSVGQDLLVVKNRAELALRTTGVEGQAREQLEQISAIVSDTLKLTREIAHNLRPAQLDRLGLATAVRSAVEHAASASGISFRVETGQVDGVLAPEAEIGVFRIVQEGVNNILKHAGATQAEVALRRDDGGIRLVITDNGRGFVAERMASAGTGISSIAERVKLMGGVLEVRSAPGSGVSLTIRIPGLPGEAPA